VQLAQTLVQGELLAKEAQVREESATHGNGCEDAIAILARATDANFGRRIEVASHDFSPCANRSERTRTFNSEPPADKR
jgi:hypothetical protein